MSSHHEGGHKRCREDNLREAVDHTQSSRRTEVQVGQAPPQDLGPPVCGGCSWHFQVTEEIDYCIWCGELFHAICYCIRGDVGNSPEMVERKQKPKGQRKLEVRRAKVEAEREELRISKPKAQNATLQNSLFRSILRCDDKTTRDDRLTRERDHFGRFLSPSPTRGLAFFADLIASS